MYTINQLTLIGFTGQDAEVHYTQNGTLVTTLSIATKESWKNAEGSWQSRSEWHRVVLFGPLAEYARTLTKGSLVLVQGAVRSREYEKDGVKHRVFEVRAETIGKLDRSERQEVGVTNHNLFPGHSRGNFQPIFRAVLRDGIECLPASG